LKPGYFHITLHDLNNPFNCSDKIELEARVKKSVGNVKRIFHEIAGYISENPGMSRINIHSSGISMRGFTGITIDFMPSTERDFRIVMNLHELFDDIVSLGNPLYMHLSLGYLHPHNFTPADRNRLAKAIGNCGQDISMTLNVMDLAYQIFEDMNSYNTIFTVDNCSRDI
jgi:hypothetical protein